MGPDKHGCTGSRRDSPGRQGFESGWGRGGQGAFRWRRLDIWHGRGTQVGGEGHGEPILKHLSDVDKLVKVQGLDEEGAGSELVGEVDVASLVGTRQHD